MSKNKNGCLNAKLTAFLALLLFALAGQWAKAEDYSVILGGNYSNPSITPTVSSTYQPGYEFGFGVDIMLADDASYGLMINALYAHHAFGVTGLSNSSANQIVLPALLYANLDDFLVELGGYFGYGVGNVNFYGTSMTYAAAQIWNIDTGVIAGIGYNFGDVKAELRYNFGLTDESEVTGQTDKNRSFDLLLSYWF